MVRPTDEGSGRSWVRLEKARVHGRRGDRTAAGTACDVAGVAAIAPIAPLLAIAVPGCKAVGDAERDMSADKGLRRSVPPRHVAGSPSQRWRCQHQRLPLQFRKGSAQANKTKAKNATVTHSKHNSHHLRPQAGFFWCQHLVSTGTPAADYLGANLLPCCPRVALLMSPRALPLHTRALFPTCFSHCFVFVFASFLFMVLTCL